MAIDWTHLKKPIPVTYYKLIYQYIHFSKSKTSTSLPFWLTELGIYERFKYVINKHEFVFCRAAWNHQSKMGFWAFLNEIQRLLRGYFSSRNATLDERELYVRTKKDTE